MIDLDHEYAACLLVIGPPPPRYDMPQGWAEYHTEVRCWWRKSVLGGRMPISITAAPDTSFEWWYRDYLRFARGGRGQLL